MSSRATLTLGALAFAALTLALHVSFGAPVDFLVLEGALGVLFIVAGYVAWRRRPEVSTGPLLVLSGALWFVGSYGLMPIVPFAALGFAFSQLYDPVLAYLLLTFPGERLTGARRLALAALGLGFFGRIVGRLLF